ncbi:hypothetical protein CU098_007099 [Rhizopus stolonifer]|uniref:MYND-type domain-containing protein n=2 Tax=Mucorineae TaxID=1344963 RepID=A0A367J5Z5_RHIST|nr:hypothetical protein CU098_007099 [Rhizopus stolonifer]
MYASKLVVSPVYVDKKQEQGSPTSYFSSSNHYQHQLNVEAIRQHSLEDAIRLASQVNMKHTASGCDRCDLVAGYYITALRYARENEPVQCNTILFDLVWQMTNLVLAHRETSKYQYLHWFDLITTELWDFAKQLKEESFECDTHIPLLDGDIKRLSIDSSHSDDSEHDEENYRRAIRITIYNCRALVCEQSNEITQAIVYYRKCASVRPTPFEPQQHLQQTALATLQRLIKTSRPVSQLKHKNTFSSVFTSDSISASSTTSSVSSLSSKTSMCCSNCGIEKQVMPVCARCKIQPYCSVRCIQSHKETHVSSCISSH